MILYHGTNQDIETIDLTKGLRYKDFITREYIHLSKLLSCFKTSILINNIILERKDL